MLILREPLAQFFLLGLLLFLVYEFKSPPADVDSKVIRIDRDVLINHMQYRSKSFEYEKFSLMLDQLSPMQTEKLLEEFIREEVLFREAKSLNLDEKDYIIRQRLVQKVEYLLRASEIKRPVNPEEFYSSNKDRYLIPRKITFTHIFFGKKERGSWSESERSAEKFLTDFLSKPRGKGSEINSGDRFVFHKNYVDKSSEHISSHFGKEFSDALFESGIGTWDGPIKSAYGHHLVYVSNISEEGVKDLEEIYDQVEWDAKQAAITELTETFIVDLKKKYKVVVDL